MKLTVTPAISRILRECWGGITSVYFNYFVFSFFLAKKSDMIKYLYALLLIPLCSALFAQTQSQVKYLSGTGSDNRVDWKFFCTDGAKSGKWTTIPVPSCWETEGFGIYNYGFNKASEEGEYKYEFSVSDEWKSKTVNIVFDGVMTDCKVKINGQPVGEHQGSFYRFRFNISSLLKYNETNLLEVHVKKWSDNPSVNLAERKADYWIFGGIFRPVWLEALPAEHIERVAIDAKADGSFSMDVFLEGIQKAKFIGAQITTMDGKPVGEPFNARVFPGSLKVNLHTQIKDPELWTSETPNRYIIKVALGPGKEMAHIITEKFGFRTIEVRTGDGIYVNGTKVIFKGVNRHSFWPTSGRTTNKDISIADVNLIKDMNMNAVRMSHYPPDVHFLDVCDSLGLFVIDELAGWQAYYDSIVGRKLVKEMVIRDVNHPCIVLWANGNEGGFNRALDKDYSLYDPQKRQVIHPWENFDGINTDHYEDYASTKNLLFNKEEIFMPTEFLHGLYDGGHGAGLSDYFNLMLKSNHSAGGFLWVFADEGLVRLDRNGEIDVAGNSAPDGIVGPYHEKEGSFYAIKEIWSPVYIAPVDPVKTSGVIKIENRYHFTNLKACTFSWSLKSFTGNKEIIEKNINGEITSPDIKPGNKNTLNLNLPKDWLNYDVLSFKAIDRFGREIYTWTWPIKKPAQKTAEIIAPAKDAKVKFTFYEDNSVLVVKSGNFKVYFNKNTGKLSGVDKGTGMIPFGNGPSLTADTSIYGKIKCTKHPDSCIVESIDKDGKLSAKWTIYNNNLIKLEYGYTLNKGEYDFMGVNFEFPEKDVKGMKWMGYGSYRVWKNRTQGVSFGVWDKEYNDTRTGDSWIYPEFKGYHRNFYWVTVKNKISDFTIYNASDEPLFLRMYTPSNPSGAGKTVTAFPAAGISFMHGISAIGTKFSDPSASGPESESYKITDTQKFSGKLYFDFR
jgi:Glycosyl hydrolases family 2, TIM barrel domain/Glycosyl hydrolases family 2, sugar binding domain/Domain of unknown function (DUF4981)/Glycosyl hydrolases family 2/Beta galactosidase small chain